MEEECEDKREWTIQEIEEILEENLKKGKVPNCPYGFQADIDNLKMYPHQGGLRIKGEKKKQWVYVYGCTNLMCRCKFQFSMGWFDLSLKKSSQRD